MFYEYFHAKAGIADPYRGQPDKIAMYFDQSIVALRQHAKPNDTPPLPV